MNNLVLPIAMVATLLLVPDVPPGTGVLMGMICVLDSRLLRLIEREKNRA